MKTRLSCFALPVAASLTAFVLMTTGVQAAPTDTSNFPAHTKLLFHVDLEKPVLKDVAVTLDEIMPDNEALNQLAELGLKSRVLDLSVCAFGDTVNTMKGSLLIHTDGKVDAVVAAMDLVVQEKKVHGDYTIYAWPKLGTKMWFALHPTKQIFVCSDNVKSIQLTLDAMDDDQKIDLGKLPMNDLTEAAAFLSSIDLGLGDVNKDEVFKKGSELIKLANKMAVSLKTGDGGELSMTMNLIGKDKAAVDLVRQIGEGMISYLEEKIEMEIPIETEVTVDGLNVSIKAETSLEDALDLGENILDQVKIPRKYGPLLQGLADKMQEMANKANDSE